MKTSSYMYSDQKKSFIKAYDKYNDAIFRYCFYRVYERNRAQELTQETFTRVWQHIADGNEIQNIRALAYKIARNLVIDESRKKKEMSLENMQAQGFNPGNDTRERQQNIIDGSRIVEKIEKLDEIYQEVIALRYIHGLKPKEIASMLDESQNVISVRIHRGIKQLRTIMDYD